MITKGASVGPYEILSPIGAGGMGEVWRARDRRIGRDVAMKVLTPDAGLSDDMVRRFEQEARAAGALNHPGLVTIFDVGTTGSSPYIVMELLDGETVRESIDKASPNPLPMRRVIDYAIQIAEALAVAHEKGIIHRDLKPENLFITNRRVKILDFGLAKLAEATQGDRKHTGRHLTSAGMVVGTPPYMSPEQVRALPLDHRTDIFSLGSVMYEMLTGKSPFERDSAIETMHTVMSAEPPALTEVVPEIPPSLEAIVRHCMEKDPRERFQSARDLAFQLRLLPETQNSYAESRRLRPIRPSRWRMMTAIGVGALVLAASGYALLKSRAASAAEELPVRTFRQLTFGDGVELMPSLAPDGKSFAFVSDRSGNRDIYVQRVDGRTAVNITADSPDDDFDPAFSPDGSQIAFRSNRDGGGIFVMGVTGESVRRLTARGFSPSWSPDGTRIVYSSVEVGFRPDIRTGTGELYIVDVRTGAERAIIEGGRGGPDFGRDSDSVQPTWSPHGKRIAFWGVSTVAGQRDIWTVDPDAREPKRTVVRVTSDLSTHWNAVWSPDGQYLYYGSDRDGTLNLWRIPMDEDTGTPSGPAEPMSLPAQMSGFYAFAHDGSLAFSTTVRSYRLVSYPFNPATGTSSGPGRVLFGGSEEPLTFEASPDGKSMAFTTGGGVQEDLFVANIDGTRVRQLTDDPYRDRGVTWSPDGKTLYFYSNRDGTYHIWRIRADGSELTRVTSEADLRSVGAHNIYVPDVSPDGRTLVARTDNASVFIHLERPPGMRLEIFGGKNTTRNPQWSPDGTKVLVGLINAEGPGFAVYDVGAKKLEKLTDHDRTGRWLPDSRRVVIFGRDSIEIADIATRTITTTPFRADFGDFPSDPRLAGDGSSFYGVQSLEQGDIWFAPAPKTGRTSIPTATP